MASFAPAPTPIASRKGKDLVVPRGATLPANCVKCGAPAERPWRKKFYWHPSWVYILFVLNLLIYALVAVLIRKKMELNVPLCEIHHGERKRYVMLAAIMLIGCIPAGFAIGSVGIDNSNTGFLAGGIMFVAGLIFLIRANNYMYAKHIDESGGRIRGAKEPFLQLLPPQA